MRLTENLKLQMPEDEDFILIEDLNANMEILDKTFKNIEDLLALLDTRGVDLADLLKRKADLDEGGKVLESQLPEIKMKDYVLTYEARGNFPTVGERNTLYLSRATDKVYYYDTDKKVYKLIEAKLDLGETSTTAYRGDRGKIAYDHSQAPHLGLGESSETAYRGDRGKIAYDHSQEPHAPADAYSKARADEEIRKVKDDFSTKFSEFYTKEEIDSGTVPIKNTKVSGGGLTIYLEKVGRVVTATLNFSSQFDPDKFPTVPVGFRPSAKAAYVNATMTNYNKVFTIYTDGRVFFSGNRTSGSCTITYIAS